MKKELFYLFIILNFQHNWFVLCESHFWVIYYVLYFFLNK